MNFFRQATGLCCSFRAYRAVRDQPFTTSFKYLLKLVALLNLVVILSHLPVVLDAVNEFGAWADANLPPFAIRDGRVETEVEQPYYAGDDRVRFILDTTGVVTDADSAAEQGILVKAETYVYWVRMTNTTDQVRQLEASLEGFPDGEVNGGYLRHLMYWMLPVGFPLAYLVAVLLALLMTLIQAYLFALIGSFIERGSQRALGLPQLLNVALHAATPGAVIVAVYTALRLEGIDLWLIYLIAYGVFLVGGTHACREAVGSET